MTDATNNLELLVEAMLAQEPLPEPSRIRELIDGLRGTVLSAVTDEEAEHLARILEERHGVSMTIGAALTETDWQPWLDSASPGITPYYWNRYRKLLVKKHYSAHVIAAVDEVTHRILDLTQNPTRDGRWDRRGLVVGHVQSGKTANYTGLICKAADAGYRVVIVMAGLHNNLRNQTQQRIDEGFVGRDSARLLAKQGDKYVGVGKFDPSRRPTTFTTTQRDFDRQTATAVSMPLQNLSEPAVFVIKKNPHTLRNLIAWLKEHSAKLGSATIDAPMLLIDDEADNASINIKHSKGEIACINGLIRELLTVFERSCYIGYTATPFANIFIDPDTDDEMKKDDLFPRSFIVSLDPPSNYFGPEKVFFENSETVLQEIDDNEDLLPVKHRKDHEVVELPRSLMQAVRTFVLARAIRLARGHDHAHCSMLVNASRFIAVQRQLRNEIHDRLRRIEDSVRVNAGLPPESALRDPEMGALHDVWLTQYSAAEFDWELIQTRLLEAVAPIRVVEVNSVSARSLDYAANSENGLSVIAVGGLALSRGLTLEGLMVSYFLRNSMMYDTLMQMGRWFGYRPDYEDLCRVWMPEDAIGWYEHISESIDMLRSELHSMEKAGATPEEFGLKVRAHPDTLIVTAREKMGSGEKFVVRIGLGNSFIETATLRRDDECLKSNLEAGRRLALNLAKAGYGPTEASRVQGGYLVSAVPVAEVKQFLSVFQNHPLSMLTDTAPVLRYIDDRATDELSKWDVLFASIGANEGATLEDSSFGFKIHCQRRALGDKSDTRTLRITNKQRVSSRGVERAGLSPEQVAAAEADYISSGGVTVLKSKNFPDRVYRARRTRPLLIVHLLDVRKGATNERVFDHPVLAWSISFPTTNHPQERVEYVVNTTWLRENFQDELEDDDDVQEGPDDDGSIA